MSINLSKKRRDNMLSFLKELKKKMEDKEDLRKLIEIERTLQEKKYGLIWEEHKEKIDEILERNIPILREIEDKKLTNPEKIGGVDSFNYLIEGDNLHSLKILEKTHRGKIDIIYIDPPYNKGNRDFIYDDNYVDKNDGYRHSKWLSFMSKRLNIAKKLLKDEGVIFISIDDKEQAQLKLLCDEVFGESNFIASITRNTNSSKNQSLYISVSHEYCLVYSVNNIALAIKYKDNKWEVEKNNISEYKAKVNKLKKMGLNNKEITTELKELTNYPRFIDFTNYWYLDERGLYQKDI